MGTYSKPELINVNPLSGLSAGIDKGFAGIAAGKTARKAREAKQASIDKKELDKKNKLRDKKIADAEELRGKLNNLDVLDNVPFESKFTGFVHELIDVDLMSHKYGSKEWKQAEQRINTYVKRSNRAIEVLTTEKQDWINAHSFNKQTKQWELREDGTTGSRLLGGDSKEQDMWYVMDALMMRDGEGVKFSTGKNGAAVGITMVHPDNKVPKLYTAGTNKGKQMVDQAGQPMYEYLDPKDPKYKKDIELNFKEYLKKKDLGGNLINTLSKEKRNKAIDNSWKSLSKAYEDDAQTIITETAANGKINKETLVSYAKSDDNLVQNISGNIDDYIPDDYQEAQNIWQQMPKTKIKVGKNSSITLDPATTTFDRNNPQHRELYASNYSSEILARHRKKTKLSNEQKKLAINPDDAYFNKIKNEGVEVSWADAANDPAQSYLNTSQVVLTDPNGVDVTLGEMIQNGNVNYDVVNIMAEQLVNQRGTPGDPDYGVSVSQTLSSLLNNTPDARLKGVTYQHGQEVLETIQTDYSAITSEMKIANGGALLPGTTDINGDGSVDFVDMLLCVAEGTILPNQNPNVNGDPDWPKNVCAWDPRSWPPGMNPNTTTLPNFTGASGIKPGELFETSGSRAKSILTLKNMEEVNLISDIIFNTLPINESTRKKIKTGYSGYKRPQLKSSQSGTVNFFSTKADADAYAAKNGGVVKSAPGGFIVK